MHQLILTKVGGGSTSICGPRTWKSGGQLTPWTPWLRGPCFQGLVSLTLTLNRVILHTVMHHSSTFTYIPNLTEIEETFVDGRTDGRTDVRTGGGTFETDCIRWTRSSWLSKSFPWPVHSVQEISPTFLRHPMRVENTADNADITQSHAANHHRLLSHVTLGIVECRK